MFDVYAFVFAALVAVNNTITDESSTASRPERWSIFQGDGMAMVVFLQRWNGDGL